MKNHHGAMTNSCVTWILYNIVLNAFKTEIANSDRVWKSIQAHKCQPNMSGLQVGKSSVAFGNMVEPKAYCINKKIERSYKQTLQLSRLVNVCKRS